MTPDPLFKRNLLIFNENQVKWTPVYMVSNRDC